MHSASLLSLAVAAPPHVLRQRDVAAAASEHFGARYPDFERLARVFETTGIITRRSVRPIEWFAQPRGWPERTAVYLEGAQELFVEAAQAALEASGVTAAEVDTVVTVSSTGIATPSLEARVFGRMGFRPDVARVPVFGLGCAGGVSGLSLAARLAEARPGTVVLFVCVELCTLAFRLDQLTKANMVATALFGDGAAACVLRGGADGGVPDGGVAAIEGGGELLWPETLGIMGWDVEDPGLGVIFDRAIPPFVEENMAEAVATIAAHANVAPGGIDRFTCHPGGAKVVAALEGSLQLAEGALDHERAVLRDNGNMSAPTVLFVLKRLLEAGFGGRTMLLALGPGFTTTGLSLMVTQSSVRPE